MSLATFWNNGVGAFTKRAVTPPSRSDIGQGSYDSFGDWPTRCLRYDFFWAHYSNTQYSQPHLWAETFKTLYALYKYTRGCYNPLYRLGEFWSTTTWGGGRLDPAKQGGRVVQSALPIIVDNDAIRDAIGKLWIDSQWAVNKDLVPLQGAVKGEVGVKIVDDTLEGQCRLEVIDPAWIEWLRLDTRGRVMGYQITREIWDPRFKPATMAIQTPGAGQRPVKYTERAYLEGSDCVFETFLNYQPYAWSGVDSKWREPYGFVPFVFIPNVRKVPGSPWGWSEYQPALTKTHETDDLSSKQHDAIRKAVNCRWFFSGVAKPSSATKITGDAPTMYDTGPGRQEGEIYYGGQGSSAAAMVSPLDLQFSSVEIQNMVATLEKDYPELRYDSARATGDASAKALREVRKAAEVKVHSRRAGYDAQLCRAQEMALAIGGMRGYPGYEDLSLPMYANGELHHSIGERSVFLMDPLDRIEEDQAFYTSFFTAKQAAIPDRIILERADWTGEEIDHFMETKQKEAELAIKNAQAATPPQAPPLSKAPPSSSNPASAA